MTCILGFGERIQVKTKKLYDTQWQRKGRGNQGGLVLRATFCLHYAYADGFKSEIASEIVKSCIMNTLSHAFSPLFLLRNNSQNNPDFCKCIHLKLRNWSKNRSVQHWNTSASSAALIGQIDVPLDSLCHTHIHTCKSVPTTQCLYYGSLLNVSQLARAIAMEMLWQSPWGKWVVHTTAFLSSRGPFSRLYWIE